MTERWVLVTGGAGFIGSHLVNALLAETEARIRVVDALTYAGNRQNLPDPEHFPERFIFIHGDVCDPALMAHAMEGVDTVFHLAAESHVARSIYEDGKFFHTDVLGTQVTASAALKARVQRFIHVSTSEVYGSAECDAGMDENHPLNPTTPYAAAKAGADRLVYAYCQTYGLPAVIVRPFNNFGPRQHLEKVIPRFVTSALQGECLRVHGDGLSTRDWLFVEDHCAALLRLYHENLEPLQGEVVNLGTGREVSVAEIATMVVEMVRNRAATVEYVSERPGQVRRHCAATAKGEKLLGWKPAVSFEQGLEKTVAWYRDHPAWWEEQKAMREVSFRLPDGQLLRF